MIESQPSALRPEPEVTISRRLLPGQSLAAVLVRRAPSLTLTSADRRRSRLRTRLDDGRIARLFLPRGTVLGAGDMLLTECGVAVRVQAAPEPLIRVTARGPEAGLHLLQAAYHLGNRHIALEVQAQWLQLEPDAVLEDMLLRLGVQVAHVVAAFHPESGAYGGGHRHEA